ncbi:MAG: YdcF family protein [Bacteroidales bacterium]|jgi:uncharacterized SAM-binding protein YcdF (DUF218 family)|nr:YdcF family protein [Bacteroidales bacterium]
MKNIIKKAAIITGLLLIVGATILSIAYGFTIGNAIAYAAGIILIAVGLWFHELPLRLQKTLLVLAGIGIIFFLTVTTMIIIYGNRDTVTFDEDCVLVFGCGIRGETVLPTLQSRLDKCLEYLEKNPDAIVILSGGRGRNEEIAEAEAMRRYLMQNGIYGGQIYVEDRSRSTTGNVMFSKLLLHVLFSGRDFTVACITSDYHAYRAENTMRRAKIDTRRFSAGVKWYLRPSAYCREVLSICKFWIKRDRFLAEIPYSSQPYSE